MVLEGETVLSYEGQRVARLKELEQDRFDGAWKTTSFGQITDFNLMVRKGSEGYIDLLFPEAENKICASTQETSKANAVHALYCKDGYCVVSVGEATQILKPGELFVMEYASGEKPEYGIMGEGTVIRAQVFYGDVASEVAPEVIPAEKATFDDFRLCVYLANVQFRWAEYMLKSLKTTWFDEALSAAIRRAERFYMPMLICLAGIVMLATLYATQIVDAATCALLIAAWVLADCLLVSPGIYMIFVPKPVRRHIKDVNELTPYEERVRNAELAANPRLEKVMKKYKNSGKNPGKDE